MGHGPVAKFGQYKQKDIVSTYMQIGNKWNCSQGAELHASMYIMFGLDKRSFCVFDFCLSVLEKMAKLVLHVTAFYAIKPRNAVG